MQYSTNSYRPPPPPGPPMNRPPPPPGPSGYGGSTTGYNTSNTTGYGAQSGFPQPQYGSTNKTRQYAIFGGIGLLVIGVIVLVIVLATSSSSPSKPPPSQVKTETCKSTVCVNGGSCVIDSDSKAELCVCAEGWTGDTCDQESTPGEECTLTCNNNGTCTGTGAQSKCVCTASYTGATCDTKKATCSLTCVNGGTCSGTGTSSKCLCKTGWTGSTCNIFETSTTGTTEECTKDCGSHGACVFKAGAQTCQCDTGYQGATCTLSCTLLCSGHGTCVLNGATQSCSCSGGYTGDSCNVPPIVAVSSSTGSGGGDNPVTGPGSYALPPPSECSNQFSVQGCIKGNTSSTCGGQCANSYGPTSRNACETGKEGVPVQFACARWLLFSDEFIQAAKDDGYDGKFNYAVVGHDPDPSGADSGLGDAGSCCQCYQLVYDKPRYLTSSKITPPMPLIVQSFNTQASGPAGFDVFMGAGGFGVFNACSEKVALGSRTGEYLYTGYPAAGQAFNGGVKPGPDSMKCSDAQNNLNDELISAATCQAKIEAACNEITHSNQVIQEESRRSCILSNSGKGYYHENWLVYVKRVTCPTHLTEVTGCKLAPETSLAAPDPKIQTVADAKSAGFKNTAGNNDPYHTTTMQDCCMPTCSWINNVKRPTLNGYNSFYSCLKDGTVVTKKA